MEWSGPGVSPPKILGKRQTRFLGKEMDGCEKLGEEEAQQDEQPQVPS